MIFYYLCWHLYTFYVHFFVEGTPREMNIQKNLQRNENNNIIETLLFEVCAMTFQEIRGAFCLVKLEEQREIAGK